MEIKDFADRETSVFLKKIGFTEECLYCYCDDSHNPNEPWQKYPYGIDFNNISGSPLVKPEKYCSAPYWYQVKNWLWDKHQIWFEPYYAWGGVYKCRICQSGHRRILGEQKKTSDSPVKAETEAIAAAVKYLHEKIGISGI